MVQFPGEQPRLSASTRFCEAREQIQPALVDRARPGSWSGDDSSCTCAESPRTELGAGTTGGTARVQSRGASRWTFSAPLATETLLGSCQALGQQGLWGHLDGESGRARTIGTRVWVAGSSRHRNPGFNGTSDAAWTYGRDR